MPRKRILGIAVGAISATFVTVPFAYCDPLALDRDKILALQNQYRADVGVAPLKWSDELAQGAQNWANTLASINEMKHSGTATVGENLAVWWGHHPSYEELIGMWGAEKDKYVPGIFPAVASDGNWQSIAHYTQMIWRATTDVGCGTAYNGRTEFLVCWYGPRGNWMGQRVL
jgi:uncharacterized protein YkwD